MRIINLKMTIVYDDQTTALIDWDILTRELDMSDFEMLADKRVRLDTLIAVLRALNKRIKKQPAQHPAKRDHKEHRRARLSSNPVKGGATTKHSKTGGQTIVHTSFYVGSGAKGSGWYRAKTMKRGDDECGHLIAPGTWFWTHPTTANIYCQKCAPEGAQ